jgi:hypothetical protein
MIILESHIRGTLCARKKRFFEAKEKFLIIFQKKAFFVGALLKSI